MTMKKQNNTIKSLILSVLFTMLSGSVLAEIPVNGIVLDAGTRLPIAAVEIRVQNRKVSTVTDEKGRFKLSVPSATDVLEVKAYDYNKTEVPVRGRTELTIELQSDNFSEAFKSVETIIGSLNQSAVTASEKSIASSGLRPILSPDDLIASSLSGDVRGINRSGASSQGASLFIRGLNSLNADAQPLFVVDGVVWESMYDNQSIQSGYFSNTLENIDLNDISSVSVIKDGSSVYGSKAANGVILITTKRSTSMVTKISVSALGGVVTQPGTVPMMKGEDFRIYTNDLYSTIGLPKNIVSEQGYLNATYNPNGLPESQVSALGYMESDPTKPIYNTYHNLTNWNDEVFRNGMNNSYMLNVMGGDDNASYYFSLGLTGNNGVVKTTDLQRINTRFNADLKLLPALDMGLNIGFARTERTMQDDGSDFYTSPTWLSKIKSPFLSPFAYTKFGTRTTDYADADIFDVGNPTAVINNSLNSTQTFRFNIGILPVYRINKDLTLSTRFDYNLYKDNERRFVPMGGTAMRFIKGYGYSENQVCSQTIRNQGIYDDTRLTYEKRFDADNHLKTTYGLRFIMNTLESAYATEHNTKSDISKFITGNFSYLQVSGVNNVTKSLSHYLQGEYDYQGRYFLTGAVSLDASSRFGSQTDGGINMFGCSWGVFPSINAGWLVSSEEFMQDIDAINFWKIRAGYGITGNDGIKDYDAMAYFSSVRFMSVANGLVLSNLENTKLQWETTAKANIGTDINLLNDQVTLSFDAYSSKTSNLLTLKDAPEITGLGKYWNNGGSMTNKGYEFSANYKALNLKHLKWELGVSAGHYTNEVTELPNGSYPTTVYGGEVLTAVGLPVGSFYGYKSLGVISTAQQAATAYTDPVSGAKGYLRLKNENGTYSRFNAGDILFNDLDQNGIIDAKDKEVIGNPNPKLYGGFSSNITVDRFSLNAQFNYSYGNQVYNYSRSLLESGKDLSNQTTVMLNRWTGDGQLTNQPRAVWGDPMGNARFSDRWIEDGSYLRLKTLTLTYDVPVKSNYLEGIKVWASADNLLTFTKYLGLDPEFSAGNSVYMQGIDAGLVPQTRTFTIGIKLNL
jgi:TonB-linked SusC/RagA family outer membrane protein